MQPSNKESWPPLISPSKLRLSCTKLAIPGIFKVSCTLPISISDNQRPRPFYGRDPTRRQTTERCKARAKGIKTKKNRTRVCFYIYQPGYMLFIYIIYIYNLTYYILCCYILHIWVWVMLFNVSRPCISQPHLWSLWIMWILQLDKLKPPVKQLQRMSRWNSINYCMLDNRW